MVKWRCVLNLGARWGILVGFTPQPLCPHKESPRTYLIWDWVRPRARLDAVAGKKSLPGNIRNSKTWRIWRSILHRLKTENL